MAFPDVKLYLNVWRYPCGQTYVTVEPEQPGQDFKTVVVAGEPMIEEGKGKRIMRAEFKPQGLFELLASELGVPALGLVAVKSLDLREIVRAAVELSVGPAEDCDCPKCVAERKRREANAN